MRIRPMMVAALVWAAASFPLIGVVPGAAASAPASFSFGAAGDFGANSNAGATLTALSTAGTDFFFALGDLSYSEATPESAWCDFVKSKVGSTYPFELVAGNHEAAGSADGAIANFAACLPNRLGPVVGSYATEGYVDYPSSQPLARFITISPNLAFPGQATYRYTVGSAHYTWLSNAIDGARAAGIRWVIVAMHEVCMTSGSMSCAISADLQNLLVGKKVDLVLQGHDHSYQRSKQLALGPSCPSVPVNSFRAGCVVDDGSDNSYTKGAGTVIVIAGTGGESLGSINSSDPEAPYFAKLMGSNSNATRGFMRYTVSDSQLTATFVRSAGGTFTDSFTISGAPAGTPPSAADISATTTAPSPVALTLRGSATATCDLTFSVVAGPSHGTLSPLSDQPCTGTGPYQDSASVTYTPAAGFTGADSFTYRTNDGTADSNPATASVTVNPAGTGISLRSASSGQNPTSSSLTIARPAGAAPGDVLLAAVAVRGTTTITPPAGWTFVRLDNAAGYTIQAVYDRVVGSSEPPSYQWTFSSSNAAAGGILDYSGVDTAAPVDAQGGAVNGSASTSIVAPSITTTAGDRVVGLFGIGGANSITPPPGMTEAGQAASTAGSLHVTWEGSDFTPPAGPTGTKTATATVAHPSVGQLVALRPA